MWGLVIRVDFDNLVQVIRRRTIIEMTAAGAAIGKLKPSGTLWLRGEIIQRLRPGEAGQKGEAVPESLFQRQLQRVVIAVHSGINRSDRSKIRIHAGST